MEEHEEAPDSSELTLVYIAKKLKDAQALEGVFETAGIEYHVEPDTYRGGLIFAHERIGAFFYVQPEDAEAARTLLSGKGYKPYRIGD